MSRDYKIANIYDYYVL